MVSLTAFFMNNEFNRTYLTLDGFVQVHKYRYLYFVIILTLYILIIIFNFTIVYLIWTHRNLHEPMYIFIAALLLNSVLFSTNVYPKLLVDFLSEKQIVSYSACLCQAILFYAIGGSEFLLLSAMAYDRYVSICKPLLYPTIMTKTTVIYLLVLAWLLPPLVLLGSAIYYSRRKVCDFSLAGLFCNNSIVNLLCVKTRLMLIVSFFNMCNLLVLPVIFILFTYARIFLISYHSCKEVRKKAAETCLPHLMVLLSFTCLCVFDIIIIRVDSDFPKTARFVMTLQLVLYHPLFNPIMYGLRMKEIYKHLKRLFW
ncbi:olfactory receptor 6N2-like [Labrus bergylta]|uniref:olfactory receptor 6N2-like n=1 Tax=Labrus bergylta TaxID=56723 RepID=UPI0033137869